MNEFALINNFFERQKQAFRQDVILGIGDDCALLQVPDAHQLVVSMDTLVSGVHFPESTPAYDIGYKALAVNLSDLAAMGATPAWFTLALTLPRVDIDWLTDFSAGLFKLAQQFNIQLIGGDTTRGPLTITIQAHGFVKPFKAVTRSGARPGDLIYVTNTLGDAGLALRAIQKKITLPDPVLSILQAQLNRPFPRIKEGLLLSAYASAMIDLSDGLISDLGHILKQSNTGALVHVTQLPLSKEVKNSVDLQTAVRLALSAGDDYELCFTIPAALKTQVGLKMKSAHCSIQCIGQVTNSGLLELYQDGQLLQENDLKGYSHF